MASGDVSKRIATLNFASEDRLNFDAYAWYLVDVDRLVSVAVGYLPLGMSVVRERNAD